MLREKALASDRQTASDQQRTISLLKHMQARLDAAEHRNREPIAIVGIGCRFPGNADTAETFWDNLNSATDCIREVPAERWDADAFYDPDPAAPGKMNTRWGGFIDHVDLFDAGFFGIAPREAVSMDPQQRLVLEVAWRALEDAGVPPGDLLGSKTGVFLGVCTGDYARIGDAGGARGALDTYSGTGGSTGVAAGRLSYTLGLNGPSLVVDTACSSSLVATHLAVNSLRTGESDLAIAGGVNLVLIPDGTITLSKLHMMAPDGRCKAFDASADGFVRGEGCGLVVLQRLSDARAQGARILAVISGSAVNQDGRSSGLTAPNGIAQEKVLREALANADRKPREVGYIEAHGTGTALGDPIEIDALQSVMTTDGQEARDSPVIIGSVKSNIGHLEAAAGIAGLIKAVGVVRSGQVPPTLHFNTPSPNIAGGAPSIRVAAQAEKLEREGDGPLVAGISSFGFSGTNAHIVLESPPPSPAAGEERGQPEILLLSARSEKAAAEYAGRLSKALPDRLCDAAFTLALGRDHYDYRMAVVARNRKDAQARLADANFRLIGDRPHIALLAGSTSEHETEASWLANLSADIAKLGIPVELVLADTHDKAEAAAAGRTVERILTDAPDAAAAVSRYGINLVLVLGDKPGAAMNSLLPDAEVLPVVSGKTDLAELTAALFERGAEIDWRQYYEGRACRRIGLPGHPFQRQSFWRDGERTSVGRDHPLVGDRIELTGGRSVFSAKLPDAATSHFVQHKVGERIIVSAAAMMDAVLTAAQRCGFGTAASNVAFEKPLVLDGPREILIEISDARAVLVSRPPGGEESRHLSAELEAPGVASAMTPLADGEAVDPRALYDFFEQGDISYGPDYRRILSARRDGNRAQAHIAAADRTVHLLDPAVFDAALQTLAIVTLGEPGPMRIPASCDHVWLSPEPADGDLTVEARLAFEDGRVRADISAVDAQDKPVMRLSGLTLSRSGMAEGRTEGWRDFLYERQWVSRPVPESAAEIIRAVETATERRISERDLSPLAGLGPRLDGLARLYARKAIKAVPARKVAGQHRRLYELLKEWDTPSLDDPDAEIAALKSEFPDAGTEIDLLARCGKALAKVLRGKRNPLDLVFAAGDDAAIYADPPVSRLLNDAVADAVCAALPEDGPIRILEVGAGTGAATSAVLDRLPGERMALYHFTDVAPSLVARAKSRFADTPWFETAVFDLEVDPEGQGIESHYDIIIAANVLHATTDLTRTLARLNRRLRPGGALIALEGAGRQGWIDLVFGMTDGWWAFEDGAARGGHAMPERPAWKRLLEASGFTASLTEAGGGGLLDRQTIVAARKSAEKNWLVLSDQDELAEPLAEELGAQTGRFGKRLPKKAFGGVVLLTPVSEPLAAGFDTVETVAALLERIRALAIDLAERDLPLVLVTRSAFSGDMAAAGAWGLGQAVSAECPQLTLRSIDLDPDLSPADAATAIAGEIRHGSSENQIRLSKEKRRIARLVPLGRTVAKPPCIDPDGIPDGVPDGIHVVTGGFGGLGLASAERLADLGARRLLLIGRSAPRAEAQEKIDALSARGVRVDCEIADIADGPAIDAIFATLDERIAGVLHCAGTLDDAPLEDMDAGRFAATLAPKVGGCLNLERHAGEADYFILFSSAISLAGAAGQANHIAASAMLDAFARRRRDAGLPAASLAFGAWREIGSASSPALAARMRRSGLDTITPQDGLAVIDWALAGNVPDMTAILPLDRTALMADAGDRVPPLFRGLLSQGLERPAANRPETAPPKAAAQSDRLPGQSMLDLVLREAALVMAANSPADIDARRTLFDQGFDSLMAVEMRDRLQKQLDRTLPSTMLFDYPVATDLADFLSGQFHPSQPASSAGTDASDNIAIIGMACRFPGGANDTQTFWSQLMAGYDGVRAWPDDRPVPAAGQAPGHAAYIDGAAAFDAGFFRISPREAVSMDPQQRILLETTWHALEDAGIAGDTLAGTPTGVYVGLCNNDYSQLAAEAGSIDGWSGTGGAPSVAAGRLAYVLGLEGPALVVDTACSSSLVALHLAARGLLDGDCNMALACAANLILTPSTTEALGALNMLSPDGRCKAFDASADGFGRGEGVGVLALKRMRDAQADGDTILATIRAIAINQDGRSSSLTAPNGRSQARLIRSALERGNLTPGDIDYVEAHGTGTELGDPIELNVLKEIFSDGRAADRPLIVGAVKSNVAHLEAAAGMAGIIKTVLALNARAIPPNIHFDSLNPHIELDGAPIVLPHKPVPWPEPEGRPRRAGVSSFGFSGTNAHVILEEAPLAAPALKPEEPGPQPQLLIVSGATKNAVRQSADRIGELLKGGSLDDLRQIAESLLHSRSQLEWRIAVVANNADQAATALKAAEPVSPDRNPAEAPSVNVPGRQTLEESARLFLAGVTLKPAGKRTAPLRKLPLYSFERTRFWFEPNARPARSGTPADEHPLLGRRQRLPGPEKRFEAEISSAHPAWLADHKVDGRPTLPAAAMMETMLSASGDGPVELTGIRFDRLVDVTEPVTLNSVLDGEDISLHAAPAESEDWFCVAQAEISSKTIAQTDWPAFADEADCPERFSVEDYYAGFLAHGLEYGPAFRAITGLHRGDGVARAELTLPSGLDHATFRLHPVLLDAAFQSIGAAANGIDVKDSGFRPYAIERFQITGRAAKKLVAASQLTLLEDGDLSADIRLSNPDGTPVILVTGLRLKATQRRADGQARCFALQWEPAKSDTLAAGEKAMLHEVAAGADPAGAVGKLLAEVKPLIDAGSDSRLVIVTHGAEMLPDDSHDADIGGSAVRGFAASLALEHPEFQLVALDTLPGTPFRLEDCPAEPGFYAVRAGHMFARVLRPQGEAIAAAMRLTRPESGRIRDLRYHALPLAEPGPGEVAIRVAAAGLNFRDVMNVLGTYPGDAGALGGECAGYIEAVGAGVTDFEPGMPVMAIAPGSHATRTIARSALTWPIPPGWSLEQAATAPTVFLTATALRDVAVIGPDKSALIHAGAGGVGLAAIAIAKASGAHILATAGSPEKREYLKKLGIEHVFDSRSATFKAGVMEATNGAGVDIVLNSLSGDLIAAGFDLLKPGGCFLELGKAGIWDDAEATAYRPDVHYHRILFDDEIVASPETVGRRWRGLADEFAAGVLATLPVHSFPFEAPGDAYRFMQEARHIGRIALTRQRLDRDAAYLVTGGTGALGLSVARRLAERGARHIILAARGEHEPDKDQLEGLARTGAEIAIRRADLSKPDAVNALLGESGRPLRGIVHAAGTLSDAVIAGMTTDQVRTVIDAKLRSAINLERAVAGQPLDFFVLFSSAAGLLGSAGQANYAAANAGLDALAHRMRRNGVPAIAIDWGAWQAGMAAGRAGPAMAEGAALAAFDMATDGPDAQVVVLPDAGSIATPDRQADNTAAMRLRETLDAASPGERLAIVRRAIVEVISQDMRIAAADISTRRPLNDYGLDSLLAVQLRNGLSALTGRTMPAGLLFDYPTVDALAGFILQQIVPAGEQPERRNGNGHAPRPDEPPVESLVEPAGKAELEIPPEMIAEEDFPADPAQELMKELERAGY